MILPTTSPFVACGLVCGRRERSRSPPDPALRSGAASCRTPVRWSGPLTARKEGPRQLSWPSATGRGSTRPRCGRSSLASTIRLRAQQHRDARSNLWAASWSHPTVWPCSCSRDRRRHSWTKKAHGTGPVRSHRGGGAYRICRRTNVMAFSLAHGRREWHRGCRQGRADLARESIAAQVRPDLLIPSVTLSTLSCEMSVSASQRSLWLRTVFLLVRLGLQGWSWPQ
jgi:hypothetical protein